MVKDMSKSLKQSQEKKSKQLVEASEGNCSEHENGNRNC